MQFFQQEDLDRLEKALKNETTGLYNKSTLYLLMDNILKQHERYEENWSFILMDCSLERISSSCEALKQEQVDKAVAEKLKSICRKSDILFYCENGLFCILTRVFEGDDTVKFCEKLSKNLKELNAEGCIIDIMPKFGITFSKLNDTPEAFSQRSYDALNKAISTKEDILVQA
ncbi:GGDEF domain-containing protein [Hippea alviniae]|uniref:GGDEF domain-containing protein n=1 Tax=Hippea alviniae TaxID=1279027 RepID=UPI0003B6D997|nr:diguanylate cyclase [Hippea alviniae]